MNPKIKKINAEYEKNAAKIEELQARQKELVRMRTDLENNDILELVHSHNMDINQLSALLQSMKADPAAAMQGETEETYHDEGNHFGSAETASNPGCFQGLDLA